MRKFQYSTQVILQVIVKCGLRIYGRYFLAELSELKGYSTPFAYQGQNPTYHCKIERSYSVEKNHTQRICNLGCGISKCIHNIHKRREGGHKYGPLPGKKELHRRYSFLYSK